MIEDIKNYCILMTYHILVIKYTMIYVKYQNYFLEK
jgi:hypothetical protein